MSSEHPARWIDTHAHLDDPVFDESRYDLLASARERGVIAAVNIGDRPVRWASTFALAEQHPDVGVVLGLHPGHADEASAEVWERLHTLAQDDRVLAIGEAGLDYFRNGPERRVQEAAFREQVRLAVALGKPLVIHQRAAESDLVALLGQEATLPRLVLHSFEGSEAYASFARASGAYVGVGGLATKTASEALRSLLATIPVDRIVLETDSPYLIPRGARGKMNTPANIPVIGRTVAPLWQLNEGEFARITTANARALFGSQLGAGRRATP